MRMPTLRPLSREAERALRPSLAGNDSRARKHHSTCGLLSTRPEIARRHSSPDEPLDQPWQEGGAAAMAAELSTEPVGRTVAGSTRLDLVTLKHCLGNRTPLPIF